MMNVGILTVSDRCAAGIAADKSGPTIAEVLTAEQYAITHAAIVPDELDEIAAILKEWSASCNLILTTGGTGLAPRDVTPEATASVIDKQAPGFSELLRASGYQINRRAILSRGICGIAGRCLIINLPGSPAACREGMEVLLPLLPHAAAILVDGITDH